MSIHLFNIGVRAAKAAVIPFSPLDISGCVGWWDASNSGSITLRSSTYVTQWNDLSGNSNNLAQSTESAQPTYSSQSIQFDDYTSLVKSAISTTLFDNKTYVYSFLVGKSSLDAINGMSIYYDYRKASTSNPDYYDYSQFNFRSTNVGLGRAGARSQTESFQFSDDGNISANTYALLEGHFKYAVNKIVAVKNSLETETDVSFLLPYIDPSSSYQITLPYNQAQGYGKCNTRELIIYSRTSALSSQELTNLRNYLNTKSSIY